MLTISNAEIVYDGVVQAVRDISMVVPRGAIVALLGSNGAGKTTLLKALSGTLDREDGKLTKGSLSYDGIDLANASTDAIVARGLVQIPEGRGLFPSLTVEENLIMGGYTRARSELRAGLDRVYDLFPRVHERRKQIAGYLSGGEQQMVVVGRALISQPRLLLLDEPSLGLAPQIAEMIFKSITRLNQEQGLTVLLVEQNAQMALAMASYGYILENGRIVLDGESERLRANPDVQEFYLGLSADHSRRSIRDVKHYKRRKRWLS